jgi:ribosomal protein S18 acetylase RimI-like enzyme
MVEIRVLEPGDEDLLIQAVALTDEGPLRYARARLHLADQDLINVVALEAGAVAGFVYGHVLRRFEATSFFIYSVDVAEPFQRQGVAKAMLAVLAEHGAAGHWDEMFVFTNAGNDAATALYRSAGGVRPNRDDVMFDFD